MSLDPERALAAGLAAMLIAAPAVTALVGTRVHVDPPRLATYPCVRFTRQESRPFGGEDGEGLEHLLTLTCASRFGGPEEARALVAAVRAALHGALPVLDGRRLITLRVTYADVFRGADRDLTLGVMRVRAVPEGV